MSRIEKAWKVNSRLEHPSKTKNCPKTNGNFIGPLLASSECLQASCAPACGSHGVQLEQNKYIQTSRLPRAELQPDSRAKLIMYINNKQC